MAETDRLMRTLAGILAQDPKLKDAGPRSTLNASILQGVVIGVNMGSLDVIIRGSALPMEGVRYLSSYRPGFGDSVWLLRFGADIICLGDLTNKALSSQFRTGASDWIEIGSSGAPAFENSWTNFGAPWATAAYCVQADGWVRLKGLVASGSTLSSVIFTMPPELRPPFLWGAVQLSNNAMTVVNISDTTGGINNSGGFGSTAYVNLSGITWPTVDAWERDRDAAWVPMVRQQNGWRADTGGINFFPMIYRRGDGWRYIKGNIEGGTATAATYVPFTDAMPDDAVTYGEMFPAVESGVGMCRFDIRGNAGTFGRDNGGNGTIIMVNNAYWSRVGENIFSVDPNYPNKSMQVWTTPAFVNGWANWVSVTEQWRGLQVTKDDFGFVHARGLLDSGAKTNNIFTNLDPEFRPAAQELFPAVQYNANGGIAGRINVFPNGDMQVNSIAANWHSVAGCWRAAA